MPVLLRFTRVRPLFALIFVFALSCLATALFAQHVLGMMPCAWCVFQRLILLSCLLFALLGLASTTSRSNLPVYLGATLLLGSSLAGIAAAWHQYTVAAHAFSCAQTFADKTIQTLGLEQALPALFGIYATCADAQVKLLGLDFALWALLMFSLIGVATLIIFWRLLSGSR